MAKPLTLFHTSPVHVRRFDQIKARIAPDQPVDHVVRPDWLDRARAEGITPELEQEIGAAIVAARFALCSCTTLGTVAETAGATRIDRAMMEDAAALGGEICLVYCVESTAQTSLDLLTESLAGSASDVRSLYLGDAWNAFEAGDEAQFAREIAQGVQTHLVAHPQTRTVILAQASMDVAVPLLEGIGVTVLSPAESALRRALSLS